MRKASSETLKAIQNISIQKNTSTQTGANHQHDAAVCVLQGTGTIFTQCRTPAIVFQRRRQAGCFMESFSQWKAAQIFQCAAAMDDALVSVGTPRKTDRDTVYLFWTLQNQLNEKIYKMFRCFVGGGSLPCRNNIVFRCDYSVFDVGSADINCKQVVAHYGFSSRQISGRMRASGGLFSQSSPVVSASTAFSYAFQSAVFRA